MPELPTKLRGDLERTIIKARDVAEAGARVALEALTVHEGKPGTHLNAAGRALRLRLRAHARQLGDKRNKRTDAQRIDHLVHECAYEHWHRMLFARFLAENDQLVEPSSGVSVTLEEVEELARDEKADPWELASRYAEGMLPQIFRPDDPVLAVALPTETRVELESLLEGLPRETFRADDSLGWVYQFWQSKKKDEVNAAGEKITGDTLPAVTQLFTEHYMVLFLLHNTIGAWHAGKVLAEQPEIAETAETEQELRDAVALSSAYSYKFEYLRFVREPLDGDPSDAPTGPWRPAAGTFDGWPKTAAELTLPRHAREPVRNGLENLYRLFSQALELGSLIDPTELPSDLIAADYETLQPFLDGIFQHESADVEIRERAVAAQGMVKAADLLARDYTLVITNVPYLGRPYQSQTLLDFADENYSDAKQDLATILIDRFQASLPSGSSVAVVTRQNSLFQTGATGHARPKC